MTIKFNTFAVVNKENGAKARVWYSLDNRCDGRKCVSLTDKDYGHALGEVFDGVAANYTNNTDYMTDYFDKGRVVIFEGDALYAEARKAVEAIIEKQEAMREKRRTEKEARRKAKRAALLDAATFNHSVVLS